MKTRRKISMGIMIFLFLFAAISETAKADPIVIIERGIELVPPGEITLRVCENVELKWVIRNILHPEVQYVTFTAAIEDNDLVEIIEYPTYTATYEVYDPFGKLLWKGNVGGTLSMEQFAFWDSTGVKLFETVTWRLPDSVVLPGDGGYINFSFQIHCEDIGTTTIVLFPRATENHGPTITDPKNLWLKGGIWYPLRDSYDPWDADISSGHSFSFYWWRFPTDTAFAWASYTVVQVEGPPIPDVDVEKSGPEKVHEGETITYTITVTNTGNCDLYNVNVNDTLLGSITTGVTLAKGEFKTYTETYTVPEGAPDPLVNTVTAEGTDALGTTVTDSDSWTVDILRPKIDVDKTGPTEAHEGDEITYTITVTNTGEDPLTNVTVTDDLLGTIAINEILAAGETKTFTKNYVVPFDGEDPLVNTVTAEGEDELGLTVTDSASWTVDIVPLEIHPKIQICKWAYPCIIKYGWWVTYKYKVTNTGDCVLYNVEITDDKLGFIKWIWMLDIGQSVTVEVSVQLSKTTKNIGTATGEDQFGETVSDSDWAFVYVIRKCA